MLQFLTGIAMRRNGVDLHFIHALVANPPNNNE